VQGTEDSVELFNQDEKRVLESYLDRNKRLEEFIKKPETVAQKVWPEALHTASRAGVDSLFCAFLSVSGCGIGVAHGQRKRQRKRKRAAQFYNSS